MALQEAADRLQVGASQELDERRHNWRSDPVFQNRFRVAMMQLVAVALVPALVLSLVVTHSVRHPDVFLDSPWVPLGTLALSIAAAALIIRRCDKVSSRYCGPTFRIIQMLQSVRRGERPEPVRVRRKDEFADLVQELNETLAQLGAMPNDD